MRLPPHPGYGRLFASLCFCIGYAQPATADPEPPVSPGKSALILVKTPPEALTG